MLGNSKKSSGDKIYTLKMPKPISWMNTTEELMLEQLTIKY